MASPDNGGTTTTGSTMDFTSLPAAFTTTFGLPCGHRFKRRVKTVGAQPHPHDVQSKPRCVKELHQAGIEALQQSFANILTTLDRIEQKVDLMASMAVKLRSRASQSGPPSATPSSTSPGTSS